MRLFFLLSVIILMLCACNRNKTLFRQLSSTKTGIHFNNIIVESDSVNVLDFENVYNGGGAGIGDFNNDGLQDIYFTGNIVSNKLYLNKGNFRFEDITGQAEVSGNGRWCRGVAVVDINNDGWLDIYVCASVKKNPKERENLLYINQGAGNNNIPKFKEMATEYGLNDTTHSTMAAFFDYDNDGDPDVYICVNEIVKGDYPNRFRPRLINGEHPSTGRLYRNDFIDSLKHPVFTDISREAGILIEGFSHSATIADINRDGWKDIYVANDYLSQNILYINNGDGTFTDKVKGIFKHTSANAMGADITDINNDGLVDLIELDMNPEDNYRKKMMMNANSYQTYQNSDYLGYQYQYVRNTLQLNRGPRVKQNDSLGEPVFSDIAFFSGIAETDWSWAPLVTDFDNDGNRDIIITNGFPKDVTDHDFVAYRKEAFAVASKQQLLEQIPAVKIHNYAFRNNGNLTFSDVTNEWGLTAPSFSNGAAYADLDNDGDMDFVVNNINDEAMVYENTLLNKPGKNKNYLQIKLTGDSLNVNGLGVWIELHYKSRKQVYEHTPYRGYLSSVQMQPHFGLDSVAVVDSVIIQWPDRKWQILKNVVTNQTIEVKKGDSNAPPDVSKDLFAYNSLFKEITDSVGVYYRHEERDFVDFNVQKLLPHKFSENGPALAAADIDGNGLDDLISGGSYGRSATMFLQQQNGTFLKKMVIPGATDFNKPWEDAGIVLFDADNDNDLDIYITSGGYENEPGTNAYSDKLYINDGKANFTIDITAIPANLSSKSCVRAADFDKDGDLDLFIAGRVEPWKYPRPVSSFIYRNDSKKGQLKFTDVTSSIAKPLEKIGLICDAAWTDFDNDGWQDLLLAGEWMPMVFLKNEMGVFENITAESGIDKEKGWWRSIVPGDFDNDGDIDYIAGNLGLNSFYRASSNYPVRMYARDFDNNNNYDAVPSIYLPASQKDPQKREYPAQVRDDMVKQMIGFRSKFQNYKLYAEATFDKMFTKDEMKGALMLEANNFSHCYIRNEGNNRFGIIPLPSTAQFSCLNGMVAEDIDGDGNLDVVINGNDYGTEVSVGRYDACNGLLFKGDGNGNFQELSITESGIFIPENGKALVKLVGGKNKYLIAASQNRGPLKIFSAKTPVKIISLNNDDMIALYHLKSGKIRREEISYGTSFLSQSSRFIRLGGEVESVDIINSKNQKRTVTP